MGERKGRQRGCRGVRGQWDAKVKEVGCRGDGEEGQEKEKGSRGERRGIEAGI